LAADWAGLSLETVTNGATRRHGNGRPDPNVREGKAMSIEQRIRDLGLELPAVRAPAANYANAVRTGNLLFLSGNVPVTADGQIPKGKVGADVTTEEAAEHARLVGLQLLAVLKAELGNLDRIRRIVKLLGMVNAVPEYTDHSKVVNGCSDLFVEVFGEKHARSSIGVGSLPFGITIEIEAVVEVE
jgi:enamine deaminase RidA (YjgF/YER057c/UK114 family)